MDCCRVSEEDLTPYKAWGSCRQWKYVDFFVFAEATGRLQFAREYGSSTA